jgi:hypothetical protein
MPRIALVVYALERGRHGGTVLCSSRSRWRRQGGEVTYRSFTEADRAWPCRAAAAKASEVRGGAARYRGIVAHTAMRSASRSACAATTAWPAESRAASRRARWAFCRLRPLRHRGAAQPRRQDLPRRARQCAQPPMRFCWPVGVEAVGSGAIADARRVPATFSAAVHSQRHPPAGPCARRHARERDTRRGGLVYLGAHRARAKGVLYLPGLSPR